MGLADYILLTFEQFAELSKNIKNNTGYSTEYSNGEIIYFAPIARHGVAIRNLCYSLFNKLPNTCLVIPEMHIKFQNTEYRVQISLYFVGKI